MRLTRRGLLAGSLPALGAGAVLLQQGGTAAAQQHGAAHGSHTDGHAGFTGGEVDDKRNGFDPHAILRDFDWGTETRLPGGNSLREWTLVATTKTIEIAPGVEVEAWAYNGRVPGPTLRAREGDRLKIKLVNASGHPHTIHWHGLHAAAMDGVPGSGAGNIAPGRETTYEFVAEPFGLHLYHCHTRPLAEHIAKGLYGAFIIDPKERRPDADELVMVMNGFDTNFDRVNEVYAVNTIPFAFMQKPLKVDQNRLVRIYLVNVLEYDLINSFHVHGNFFDYFPTGTSLEPVEFTDTVMQCQGQRGILEMKFPRQGHFMFHAHQSEFAELGWQGFFEVCDPVTGVCEIA
jgi:FtsP/CotA-like multicopper oxidase with cupredoxin domain